MKQLEKMTFLVLFLITMSCSMCLLSFAEDDSAQLNDTIITQQAKNFNITSPEFIAKVQDVSVYATKYFDDYGAHTWTSTTQPNTSPLTSVITAKFEGVNTRVVTFIDVAPLAGGKIQSDIFRVHYDPRSAAVIREETFENWVYANTLNRDVLVLKTKNEAVYTYLVPVGDGEGTLIVRRE